MPGSDDQSIKRLQQCLAEARRLAGWTAERLGDEIGVSRQTIGNIEKGRSPLNKTQYIAIRAVFNQEIARNGNKNLANFLVDNIDKPVDEGDETESMRDQRALTRALTDGNVLKLAGAFSALGPALVGAGVAALAAAMLGEVPAGGAVVDMARTFRKSSR